MPSIAVIMTCHNRREATVAALRSFAASADRTLGVAYRVFLVDDGSTDGTASAVASLEMPVTVIPGPGDLFWNRGMVRAWMAAQAHGDDFDGYLLLNDDTVLDDHALATLLATDADHAQHAIVVGAVRDPNGGYVTYGGVRRTSRWHPGRVARLPRSSQAQPADTFNANCVYVPALVCEAIGILDPTFHHAMGDFDYGYRATRHGYRVIVAPDTVGACARNPVTGTWRDPAVPLRRRLALLGSPKGLPRREWSEFLRRHGAPWPGALAWLPTLQVLQSSRTWRVARTRRP